MASEGAALWLLVRSRSPIDNHSFRHAFVQREKMGIFSSADVASCRRFLIEEGYRSWLCLRHYFPVSTHMPSQARM
jgi:hypothetical protein